jgi:hypothetical protein
VYDHLVKLVNRVLDARSEKINELVALVSACRQLQVAA